ncbi:MAG TPA: hypothetical protein VIW03_09835, partial [Anaeromyxobacter sp.]
VAIVLGVAAFGAILSWRARRPARTPLRAAEPVAAAAVPAALLVLLWPGLAGGVARGLVPLAASNPWYADIREFGPALFAGLRPVTSEIALAGAALGLVPLAAALAVPASVRRRRADPRCRPPVLFLASWFAVTFALSLARIRFFPYFVAPCAIAAASGALWAGEALAARLGRPRISLPVTAVVVAASLAPAAAALPALAAGADGVPEPWIAATRWLREAGLPPDARRAVAAPWGLGHLVQYYGDRPVIASPFGTEAGPEALPDWTSFLFTGDPAAAEAVLLRRGVSHLVLQNPVHELVGLRGFAPPGARPLVATRSPWTGETVIPTPRLPQLVASRLYFGDGLGGDGSLEAFRLVYEGASTRPPHPLHEERIAIFELVAGATLRVAAAPPGVLVSARVGVVTNAGRSFTWSAHRIAGPTGAASFRVPYATGANGAARASACEVLAGASRTAVSIADRAVEEGAEIAVALGPWREVH